MKEEDLCVGLHLYSKGHMKWSKKVANSEPES